MQTVSQVLTHGRTELAKVIVGQEADGHLVHFERVGYVVVAASLATAFFIYRISRTVPDKHA